ncbi:RIP homotypic interaction motif-containing protein [Streptomyces pseudovenezuelae]|uniref:RIP homotypic interaction motif-containing protein n=1 Tax=Streptomyces pseudovenezuelae TaxID=67350 RepID=UPI0037154DFE
MAAVIVLGLRRTPCPAPASVPAAPPLCPPETEPLPAYRATTPAAGPQPDDHEGVEFSGPWLVLVGCQGAQVGEHNRQINVYTYRLEEPEVDFTEILKREDVHEALLKVVENPGDVLLRRRAVNLLRGGRWQLRRQDVIDLGPREPDEFAGEAVTDLYSVAGAGAVIVSNCRDVQIGNHNVQRTKHHLVYRRSSVNTFELLERAPRIAASLVDVVTGEQPEKGMEKLCSELTSALNSQRCGPESVAERVGPGESRSFVGELGVSVGRDRTPRQRDITRVETQLSVDGEWAARCEDVFEELHAHQSSDVPSVESRDDIPGLDLIF